METDEKLRALLRADAPPARDPFFRLALLERRTRQRYQRQQRALYVGTLLVAMLGLVVLRTLAVDGFTAPSPALLRAAGAAVAALGIAAAAAFSLRGTLQLLRQRR